MASSDDDMAEKVSRLGRLVSGDELDEAPLGSGLSLPNGRDLAEVDDDELANAMDDLEIPGAKKSDSRAAQVALYRQFLCDMYHRAGEEAVDQWAKDNSDDGRDKRKRNDE